MHSTALSRPPVPPVIAPAGPFVDPAKIQQSNSAAPPKLNGDGPSATSPKTKTAPKRKRTGTPDDGAAPDGASKKNRDGPRRKKANRACFHCQKAHLTCDDSRPCQRCVKRGLADNCTEGHRKKAKYLLDEEELEELKKTKSSPAENTPDAPSVSSQTATIPPTPPQPQQQSISSQAAPVDVFPTSGGAGDPFFSTAPLDPNYSFGSEAANLEYSILSAILGNPSPSEDLSAAQSSPSTSWPPVSNYPSYTMPQPQAQMNMQPADTTMPAAVSMSPTNYMTPYTPSSQYSTTSNDLDLPYSSVPFQQQQPQQPQQMEPMAPPPAPTPLHPLQPRDFRPRSPLHLPSSAFFRDSEIPRSPAATSSSGSGSQLQTINDRVTAPYDYTVGYHFLMKFLQKRFEKNDILRIVRALAIFRPSLIALQMPLTEEDEVFVEKCFQRSLLELDKLISFSGTPTVAWRRTGEICLVAPEFCTLTGWRAEDLLQKRKYIYELFENQSVVEYWESFATHAFENTTQSVYSHCVLLKPNGAPIPATFCFSIRRDIFDLPSLVIGQWLPLL